MATKEKTVWFCTNCGNESPKWMGKCPACGQWNTMVEQTVATGKANRNQSVAASSPGHRPMNLKEIDSSAENRIALGLEEIDRLLGGGIVKGSLVLIGGEPGIGKSTLSLQTWRRQFQLLHLQRNRYQQHNIPGRGAEAGSHGRGFCADNVFFEH